MADLFTGCATREACARCYAELLLTLGTDSPRWPEINAEILSRYTTSGLNWIKARAWRIAREDGNG